MEMLVAAASRSSPQCELMSFFIDYREIYDGPLDLEIRILSTIPWDRLDTLFHGLPRLMSVVIIMVTTRQVLRFIPLWKLVYTAKLHSVVDRGKSFVKTRL